MWPYIMLVYFFNETVRCSMNITKCCRRIQSRYNFLSHSFKWIKSNISVWYIVDSNLPVAPVLKKQTIITDGKRVGDRSSHRNKKKPHQNYEKYDKKKIDNRRVVCVMCVPFCVQFVLRFRDIYVSKIVAMRLFWFLQSTRDLDQLKCSVQWAENLRTAFRWLE